MDTLSALTARELSMEDSRLYFGGVPPDFEFGACAGLSGVGSLLGSMRAITTSNPGSNSLLNPLYTEQAGYRTSFFQPTSEIWHFSIFFYHGFL